MPTGQDLIAVAHQYLGLPYRTNPQWNPGDTPTSFDCSEFTEWVCLMAGSPVRLRESSVEQFQQCREAGRVISVADAVVTPGALLFAFRDSKSRPIDPASMWPSFRHVSFAIGNGTKTIEAYGADGEGVAIKGMRLRTDANGNMIHRFNFGALAPGVDYPGFTGDIGGGGGGPTPPVPGGIAARYRPRNDKRILKRGLVGEDVREAQSMLIAVGAPSLAGRLPTPNFAELTTQAVAWFQQKVLAEQGGSTGMRVTHQIGPVTWGWLYAYTGR